ncbi:hypothetical protein [Ferrimicrobium sp.]|uniref:hypothetical protein n=1 Tax=Ferrimicrobium sp. TaxID=2926050 RepID=UPI00261D3110|nr:hypothetical protein [Ferrimicrobium sp.]
MTDSDERRERMLEGLEDLLSQLDDVSFSQLLSYRRLDPVKVKQVQQELAKVRRSLLKAQQILRQLDLTIEEMDQ